MDGKRLTAEERAQIKEARSALRDADRRYRDRVREHERLLSAAEKAHRSGVSTARRELRRRQKEYDKAVSTAQKAVAAAKTGRLLGSCGSVKLYQTRIETPSGTAALSRQVRAKVQSSGRKTSKSDSRKNTYPRSR